VRVERRHCIRAAWSGHVQKESFPYRKPFTRLLGKKILPPGPIDICGVWPFESAEEYPEFIIGEDEHGRPVRYTCDPDQLANYFGKNDHALHYLTPVHFRKEVLQKYYDRPELYSVSDGGVRCAAPWSCRIDNESSIRVLTQLLVDALNEKQIESRLSTKQPNEKGISKLERLFAQEKLLQGNDVKVLRSLQELRSRVTAHRKGSDYEKVLDKNFGNRRGREAVECLMQNLLDWLSKVLESLQASRGSA
jgi:hypothetical protein